MTGELPHVVKGDAASLEVEEKRNIQRTTMRITCAIFHDAELRVVKEPESAGRDELHNYQLASQKKTVQLDGNMRFFTS